MKIIKIVGVVMGFLTLLALAFFITLCAALWFASNYMVEAQVVTDSVLIQKEPVVIDLCELSQSGAVELVSPLSCLEVVYNYGEQKTAPINVLEPKVSDVYLQYAPQLNEYDSTLYFDTATNTVKNGSMQSMVNVVNLAKELL